MYILLKMQETISSLRLKLEIKVRRLMTMHPSVFRVNLQYFMYAFALKFSLVTHKIMLLEKCLAPY